MSPKEKATKTPVPAKENSQVSPAKSLVDELDLLDILLNRVGQSYLSRLSSEIKGIRTVVYDLALQPEIDPDRLRDIREMLMLLRSLQTKPEKGRRKDLKKIDELIGDLENYTERW